MPFETPSKKKKKIKKIIQFLNLRSLYAQEFDWIYVESNFTETEVNK